MIKLELTGLDAEFLMQALKIAEKQERKKACNAANEMEQEEAHNRILIFNALRNVIFHEVKKGGQNAPN